jgi:hypothetical protein
MLDFYNDVYAAPLFGMAIAGLLLFMVGGVLIGSAIVASRALARWTGWVFAAATVLFVISTFTLTLGQSVTSAALIAANIVIALQVSRRQTAGRSLHATSPEERYEKAA